ncbi:MAG TPA: aminoglycoside 6-adenylyltransferase [Longimicrobiaceae bacterium]|nr:aminoglycoside 6-adenylyltransferase [Longimicrobiaceae bacterium]
MEEAVIRRIVRWAEGRAEIRAVVLTSTRVRAGAPVDALSDWDVMLFVLDPTPFLGDGAWAGELGPVLVQMPPRGREDAWDAPTRLVLYEDGARIDFSVFAVGVLREAGEASALPEEVDAGYRVLLDKDGLAAALPAASGRAYVLRPPTREAFDAVVEEFWWETAYVAKNLWRGELLPAKYSLECVLKLDLLRRMLEWRVALDHGWTYRPGVLGRGLKAHLPPERWSELEQTFSGAEMEEGWGALWRTIALFRTAAIEVAGRLALEYPHGLDARMARYLERIRTGAGSDAAG